VAVLTLAALALLLAGNGRADDATISWGSATYVSGDSEVKTDGTTFGALNLGASGVSNATVNGVKFTAAGLDSLDTSDTFGDFKFDSSVDFTPDNTLGSSSSFFTNLSLDYQHLLSSAEVGGGFTLTISNLTVGHKYEFEWWSNASHFIDSFGTTASDSAGNSVTLQSNTNAAQATVGLGQFAVGKFTADATTETITFGGAAFVNGVQLRDETSATSTPQPASLTLLATGALGLLGYGWRRRRQAGA
jgi:MYXO-CTERM domain-containing protein